MYNLALDIILIRVNVCVHNFNPELMEYRSLFDKLIDELDQVSSQIRSGNELIIYRIDRSIHVENMNNIAKLTRGLRTYAR